MYVNLHKTKHTTMTNKIDTKEQITAVIVLETRSKKKDGTHSVKLRITHKRKQKYFNVKYENKNLSLSKEDFNKAVSPRPRGSSKELKKYLMLYENKAIEIIGSIDFFTFEIFEEKFFNKTSSKNDVFAFYESYIDYLTSLERFSTAETYELSMKALKKKIKKETLHFKEITPKFLNLFEKDMLDKNKSITTISILKFRSCKHLNING